MPKTMTYTGELVVTRCWCGIELAVPRALWSHAQDSPRNQIYCPLGHTFVYSKGRAAELQEELEKKERALAWERSRRDQAEAEVKHQRQRAAGYKGQAAKVQKRAARALCPAPGCKRSFVNVARHIETCHPDFHPES